MNETILQKLLQLEQSENIKILYACESGSRAWGFASPDSDFDVRFIYARPAEDYLSINDLPDTVGLPVDEVLDISGWDIKKTLKLFLKSNGPLYEWLQSPIVYQENLLFADNLRKMMPRYFCLRAGAHHYMSMAYNTFRDDLGKEEVKLKRYFYALRSALACLWINERQTVPPMVFNQLRVLITDIEVQISIDELLKMKKEADEQTIVPQVQVLNTWLEKTLLACKEGIPALAVRKQDTDELNTVFRNAIQYGL